MEGQGKLNLAKTKTELPLDQRTFEKFRTFSLDDNENITPFVRNLEARDTDVTKVNRSRTISSEMDSVRSQYQKQGYRDFQGHHNNDFTTNTLRRRRFLVMRRGWTFDCGWARTE